ncbi:CRISPR-associated endoribonuclease Cas6 [Bacillus bombysepticus]|uniref:CRISPR-associated endoribonuclease Cas6 n=1 Tax=Bacillus bombysepticus TaxID=658666 RepID=UPI00301A956A
MRLENTYKCEKLPLSYRKEVISYFKRSLELADPAYYRSLYFYGDVKNKQTKPFAFSVNMKHCQIEGDEIQTGGEIRISVTSNNPQFMMTLYNGMLQIDTYEYKGYKLERVKTRVVPEHTTFAPSMTFATMSPILVKNKQGHWLDIEDADYLKELQYTANLILKECRGNGLRQPLYFLPVNMKKVVVKEKITEYIRNTGKKYLHFMGYTGMFQLAGHPEDLKDLYQLGLSMRRNAGFGMIQVVG